MSLPTESDEVVSQWDRYAQLPEGVLFAGLPPRAVVLFAALMRYSREESTCAPSRATLAKKLGWSRNSVDRAAEELVEGGFLRIHRAGGRPGDPWSTNTYTLVRPWTTPGPPVDHPWSARGDTPGPPVGTEREQPQRELPREDPTLLPGAAAPSEREAHPTVAELFDRWWSVYPRKTAKDAARRAYAKALRSCLPSELLGAAERYRDDPTRDPAFTAYPATWLNAGRWQDEGPVRPSARRTHSTTGATRWDAETAPQTAEEYFR